MQQGNNRKEPEKAGTEATDKKKKYEVMFTFTQYSLGKLIIEAKSRAEAKRLAEAIPPWEVDDFKPVDGELYVVSIVPVEEDEGGTQTGTGRSPGRNQGRTGRCQEADSLSEWLKLDDS